MPAPKQGQQAGIVRRSTRVSTLADQSCNLAANVMGLRKPRPLVTAKKTTTGLVKKENSTQEVTKRKAEKSPFIDKTLKRSAFGDLTNAATKDADTKKTLTKVVRPVVSSQPKLPIAASRTGTVVVKPDVVKSVKETSQENNVEKKTFGIIVKRKPLGGSSANILPPPALKNTTAKIVEKPKVSVIEKPKPVAEKPKPVPVAERPNLVPEPPKPSAKPVRRSARLSDLIANSSEDNSLYVTAIEDTLNVTEDKVKSEEKQPEVRLLPPGVKDFDKEYEKDPLQSAIYAYEIFNYLKLREPKFRIPDYMHKQTHLKKYMRSVLIDWMVGVQETFELTHETLYMAVKMVDIYLSKILINQEKLQLIGAVSLFIACKFEERMPPAIDDFVMICDDAYSREKIIETEITVLKVVDYDLGYPLSYTFLRRYARSEKIEMPLLTLARFILEYCLMDYTTVTMSDSKLAAAALHIARVMHNGATWSPTLEYFSGYKLDDFKSIAYHMNDFLHKRVRESLSTVWKKYSEEIFFEVTKTPLVDNSKL